jgi:PAS domain S-box-containing protein
MTRSPIDLTDLRVGAEELLAAVLAATERPLWVVDHADVIRFANPAALNTLGYERTDDLWGRERHSAIHYRRADGTAFPAAECRLLRTLATGEPTATALDWFVRRDGSLFPVSYVSVPLEMEGGCGAVVAFTNIETEQGRVADEQAALRRVATLVARAVPRSELFAAVASEVGGLLRAEFAGMIRYERDGSVSPIAVWAAGSHPDAESPLALLSGAGELALTIPKTRSTARIDNYDAVPGKIAASIRQALGICSSVGSPILVDGQLWGALFVHSTNAQPLPPDTESRLLNFSELVATAISNSEARAEVERLVDEQAGLRRVAMLVAREAPPAEVFATVREQVGRLLAVEDTAIWRYEADATATVVATSNDYLQTGDRVPLQGESVAARVFRTGRPARLEDYSVASGELGSRMREAGFRAAVGAPIVVEGRLWGVIVAATRQDEPLPAGVESRIGEFTELVATAISNVQAWSDLAASRARIVEAADDERRRVVRDLHDGAQQRLVHTVLTLKMAQRALEEKTEEVEGLVSEALDNAEQATEEVRELAHGILPAVLTRGGLAAGVEVLASRTPVPVDVDIPIGRLPGAIEATAYFVIAEALTNVAKHARANFAEVHARIDDGTLRIDVRDDGIGGVRSDGSGLLGLRDRLAVLEGRLHVESDADGGTRVCADIPIPGAAGATL